MNGLDFRSSQSSYGDPRHFSAASYGAPQPPPTKVLLDGYRNQNGTEVHGLWMTSEEGWEEKRQEHISPASRLSTQRKALAFDPLVACTTAIEVVVEQV